MAAEMDATDSDSHSQCEEERKAIVDILADLGLSRLLPQFEENKVGPREVEALSEEQFNILGVLAIGDRARLKQRCKDFIKGKSLESPSVKKFIELNTQKQRNLKNRKGKTTRKLYFGWKHMNRDGTYCLMHPSKGGGQIVKDISKDVSREELEEIIRNEYFPDGISLSSNMRIQDYETTVVNYVGHKLPDCVSGKPFTVDRYCESRNCTPIRIYLQTKMKYTENVNDRRKKEDDLNKSDEDFEMFADLGTPTVSLNRRGPNRLSLTQGRSMNRCNRTQQPVASCSGIISQQPKPCSQQLSPEASTSSFTQNVPTQQVASCSGITPKQPEPCSQQLSPESSTSKFHTKCTNTTSCKLFRHYPKADRALFSTAVTRS